jgi:Protein of unknown function (DUF3341)
VKTVYALYPDPGAAQRAVDELRAAGVPNRDITVISSEPFEAYEFSHRDKATWLYWIAGFGGLVGCSAGTFLTWYTESAWPLVTGGMPIVAWWPNLIVMFELTMLGAILATVIALFASGPLLRSRPSLHDPEVMEGNILVGVESPSAGSFEAVERVFTATAGRLKSVKNRA